MYNFSEKNWNYAYMCGHNLLKAHAKAYHIYDDEFRSKQSGIIGVSILCDYYYPKEPEDNVSAEVEFQFLCGKVAHPIFSKSGDYPEIFKQRILESSKKQGLEKSMLPTFSPEWIQYIK